ncbi:MAG: hypothetical protein U0X87_18110 [Anaerolineales bacterium]
MNALDTLVELSSQMELNMRKMLRLRSLALAPLSTITSLLASRPKRNAPRSPIPPNSRTENKLSC